MIRSFKCRETERIWAGSRSLRLPDDIQGVARRKLRMLANAQALQDLRVPPNNHKWRLCFHWRNGDAWEVEIVDYH